MPPKYSADDVRKRMHALRDSLDDNVAHVASSVRVKTDWRYYVRQFPWLAVGGATAVGYLLVPRRVEKVERIVADADALARLAKDEKIVMAPAARVSDNQRGVINKLAAFALAAGSRAAVAYLSNKLGSVAVGDDNRDAEHPSAHVGARPK